MEDVSSAIAYAVVEFVDSARLWGVASGLSRYFAAVPLLCDHRDKAVAALRVVDATARFDISFAAGANLEVIGEINRGTGADGPNPFPEEVPTNAERYAMLLDHIRELEAET